MATKADALATIRTMVFMALIDTMGADPEVQLKEVMNALQKPEISWVYGLMGDE